MKSDSKNVKGEKSGMDLSKRKFPADISDDLRENIRKIAAKIFCSIGLRGVVRIDFLLDEVKNKLYVCEVNAVPGSLAYYFFNKSRVATNDLIYRLISIAEEGGVNREIDKNFIANILDQ